MTYREFIDRFKCFAERRPDLVLNTLSNIFTMRLVGNKTHGDLAEIGICEFINQFIYDLGSIHVGKEFYRAKSQEEDIVVIDRVAHNRSTNRLSDISTFHLLHCSTTGIEEEKQHITLLEQDGIALPISLKAYGDGPLQLSTDKDSTIFSYLENELSQQDTQNNTQLHNILGSSVLQDLYGINVMSFIYDEVGKRCKIVVFDIDKALAETAKITYLASGNGRKHPIYKFTDKSGQYIMEVRYGGKAANALQRGVWTNTKNATSYFIEITNGWIDYSHNTSLVKLFALALNSSKQGHDEANRHLQEDINELRDRPCTPLSASTMLS